MIASAPSHRWRSSSHAGRYTAFIMRVTSRMPHRFVAASITHATMPLPRDRYHQVCGFMRGMPPDSMFETRRDLSQP